MTIRHMGNYNILLTVWFGVARFGCGNTISCFAWCASMCSRRPCTARTIQINKTAPIQRHPWLIFSKVGRGS